MAAMGPSGTGRSAQKKKLASTPGEEMPMSKTRNVSRRAVTTMLALGPAMLAAPRALAQAPKDPPVFKIGALLGLTDKANWNALVMQRGILMAVDEINAAGGIDGIKVEAVIVDHQGVPRVGVDALQRLRAA